MWRPNPGIRGVPGSGSGGLAATCAWSLPTLYACMMVSPLVVIEVLDALERWGRARKGSRLQGMWHGWMGFGRQELMAEGSGVLPPNVTGDPIPILARLPKPLPQPTKASVPSVNPPPKLTHHPRAPPPCAPPSPPPAEKFGFESSNKDGDWDIASKRRHLQKRCRPLTGPRTKNGTLTGLLKGRRSS